MQSVMVSCYNAFALAGQYHSSLHNSELAVNTAVRNSVTRPPPFGSFPQWLTSMPRREGKDVLTCAISRRIFDFLFGLDKEVLKRAYFSFFRHLYKTLKNRGYRTRGPVTYTDFIPPWLSNRTSFIDGETGETLAVLPLPHIPGSTYIVRRGGKAACCAVIAGWFRYETTTSDVLKHFLVANGIDIEVFELDTRPSSISEPQESIAPPSSSARIVDNRSKNETKNALNLCESQKISQILLRSSLPHLQCLTIQPSVSAEIVPSNSIKTRPPISTCVPIARSPNSSQIINLISSTSVPKTELIEPVCTVGQIKVYRNELDDLISQKHLTGNVINAFFSIVSEEHKQATIMDSLFLAISTVHVDPIPQMNKFISSLDRMWSTQLLMSRRLIIPANKPGENAHWGLLVLDIGPGIDGRISLLDSAKSACLLESLVSVTKKWAESPCTRSLLGNWWPPQWNYEPSCMESVQQEDNSSCGVFTCVNGLILARGNVDSTLLMNRSIRDLRSQIHSTILTGRVQVK